VLGNLNDEDKQLAAWWAEREGDSDVGSTLARMLSARAAEKVALDFYREFSQSVEDISITQLRKSRADAQGSTEDWKLYDIRTDGRSLDVKNARVPVNNPQTYVEHYVPRFKRNRGHDVKIAGVVSPWVTIEQFQRTKRLSRYVARFRVIGEADLHTAERLERSFAALAARSSTTIVTVRRWSEGAPHFLPAWLFDYPDSFYSRRDRSREWLLRAPEGPFPSLEELKLTGIWPLPAFLGARRALPPTWCMELSPWQREFYNRVQGHPEPVSLPVLFLHLLLHFLEVSRSPTQHSDYSPEGYRKLLYASAASEKNSGGSPNSPAPPIWSRISRRAREEGPAGVVDPLSIISTLIDALRGRLEIC
jgi:hypothetical protein